MTRRLVPVVVILAACFAARAAAATLRAQAPAVEGQARPGAVAPGPRLPPRDRQPEATGTAVLRGRVVAADTGAPLRRVLVQASGQDVRRSRSTLTDRDGRFELAELPAGRYTISASKGGYVTLQFGQTRPFESGRPVALANGQTQERIDFTLPRGSVIAGRVLDEFGDPVADAVVQPLRYRYVGGVRRPMPVGRSSQTNDIGQFRLFGLMPGEYYVSASVRTPGNLDMETTDPSGYAPTYYPGTSNLVEAQRVTLGLAQEVTGVEFTLVPARLARVSGVILDADGRPAAVRLMVRPREVSGIRPMTPVRVQPDGTFTVQNLAPGEYIMTARSDARGGGAPAIGSQTIAVTGADVGGVTIVLSGGGVAKGAVEIDGGAAPSFDAGALRIGMTAIDPTPGFGNQTARVGEDWRFELRGLSGRGFIRVADAPGDWRLKAVLHGGADVTDTPIDFDTQGSLDGLRIVLTDRVTEVTGGVTDARGQAVGEYVAVLFAEDADRWMPQSRFIGAARPDQSGQFRIRGLPAGRYLAVALEYLEQGAWTDPELLAHLTSVATPVTIGEGEAKGIALKISAIP